MFLLSASILACNRLEPPIVEFESNLINDFHLTLSEIEDEILLRKYQNNTKSAPQFVIDPILVAADTVAYFLNRRTLV